MTMTIIAITHGIYFGGTGLFILHFLEKIFKQSEVAILPCRFGGAKVHRAGALKL